MGPGTSWADIASWVLLGAAGLVALFVVVGRRAKVPHCPKCSYEVGPRATSGSTCPECGYAARSDQAWWRRRRRTRLLWAAGVLGMLSYGAAVTPRVAARGVYGLPPTCSLALVTVWSDPADAGTPLAAAWGFGNWRKEMHARADEGDLRGLAGRLWAWNTQRAWAKATVKPGAGRFQHVPLGRVGRAWGNKGLSWQADVASLLTDSVSPEEWIENGGARQQMVAAESGLFVYAPKRDIDEIERLVALLGRRDGAVVCEPEDAASIALARRVLTTSVSLRNNTQTMAELLEQVRGTLACELGDNASAVVAGGTVLRPLKFVPEAGTCDEVLWRGLEAIGAQRYDAEWSCEAGKLVVRDRGRVMVAVYPYEKGAATLDALVANVDVDGWRESGGDRSWRRILGDRLVVFASARVHALIAEELEKAKAEPNPGGTESGG